MYLIEFNMGGTWIIWDTAEDSGQAQMILEHSQRQHPHNEFKITYQEPKPPSDIDTIRMMLNESH